MFRFVSNNYCIAGSQTLCRSAILNGRKERLRCQCHIFRNFSASEGIKFAGFRVGEKMIETGTLLQNRYLIEKRIGEGGMGVVYEAIDQRFGNHVAIKETFYKDVELSEAFEREAHLLNSLHHSVLPHVSDFFSENNGYFLVMQFIEGKDLSEIIKREGAFPLKKVLHWTYSLLEALDYLHSQEPPIIHRDIKPQNLKITPRGDVVLLDFGLAKLNSDDTTGVKSVFGYSRKYSSLEQIQGTGTDARSDIFSLGATIYHLLTGKPPIEVIARASAIVKGDADPLKLASEINTEVPEDVAHILNSALALNAAQRFASAKAMRQALEYAVNGTSFENTANSAEVLPVEVIPADSNPVINSAEVEGFAALDSFANENSSSSKRKSIDSENIEMPIRSADSFSNESLEPVIAAPKDKYKGGVITQIAMRTKPSHFRFAALSALLICGVLGALYFIAGTTSSDKVEQNPNAAQINSSNPNNSQSATVLDVPITATNNSSLKENVEQAKSKSSTEKNSEKKAAAIDADSPVETAENISKQEISPVSPSVERQQTPRRKNQQAAQNQTEAAVIEEEDPALDIESIFTGRPSDQREATRPRRKQQDEFTEEEWREMRRQRRRERRQRQIENEIPF